MCTSLSIRFFVFFFTFKLLKFLLFHCMKRYFPIATALLGKIIYSIGLDILKTSYLPGLNAS